MKFNDNNDEDKRMLIFDEDLVGLLEWSSEQAFEIK